MHGSSNKLQHKVSDHRYLQLFVWDTNYSSHDLAELLEARRPELIEWIAPYEVNLEWQHQYQPLVEYKQRYPKTEIRVLTNNGLGTHVLGDGLVYESYPLMFVVDSLHYYGVDNILDYQPQDKFKYKLVSMNNNGHYFRCMMIDYFEKHRLLNDPLSLITWQNKRVDPDYQYRWFKPRAITLDDPFDNNGGFNAYKLIPQYHDCFLNVIAESSPTELFVTEKTLKPILWLKPFIILGCPGYNRFLKRTLGFELFEELVDYSYDQEQNLESRIAMFTEQVERFSYMSITALERTYKKILPKLMYNRQRAIDLVNDRNYDPKLVTEWQNYRVDQHYGNPELTTANSHRQNHWYFITDKFKIGQSND